MSYRNALHHNRECALLCLDQGMTAKQVADRWPEIWELDEEGLLHQRGHDFLMMANVPGPPASEAEKEGGPALELLRACKFALAWLVKLRGTVEVDTLLEAMPTTGGGVGTLERAIKRAEEKS